ncbi:MAG: oligopeptidase A [Gammaproteobacteria bacterium]|nr:MAG: oligopeptidase A [Gammaproteobacteria bacterium]PIE37342.1 MAG: oligopeptidase A [Gammaproteobacteria bacterium]
MINRPDWNAIDVAKIEPELDRLITAYRDVVAGVEHQDAPTWDSLVQPLVEAQQALLRFWSPISHLNAVVNNEALREVYNRSVPRLSALWTELGQNAALQKSMQRLADSEEFASLSPARQQQIRHELRDFELGGVALPEDEKARFSELAQSLSLLQTAFADNVLDATNAWEKWITDVSDLAGLPDSAVAAARQRAERKRATQSNGEEGDSSPDAGIEAGDSAASTVPAGEGAEEWLINLEFPSYIAVMTYADNRELRQEIYTAFVTRASELGPDAGRFDNGETMQKILMQRAEIAKLLGFANAAELSMVKKMVETPEQVLGFLEELAEKSLPQARAEMAELEAFAAEHLGLDSLQAWDVPYASDKLKQHKHDLSDEDLKPYFPASRVVPGLFAVVGRLFGLRIEPVEGAEVYHPDVTLHAVFDRNGERRGEFYFDNHAREKKRGGAWMDVCTDRVRLDAGVQLPIAYLTCNLTPPVGDDPALLTHAEVTTLFHEFGHGLHHMLTRIDAGGVSGINGVEWDAVELPSQFLENWCWERESIDMMSGHYQTGEKIPDELLARLQAAKNFQSGMQMVRQLEFALFDMHIHIDSTPEAAADIQGTLDRVRRRVAVLPVPDFNRFQHSFSHIFAGGYAAGYFSYKWAEVLSADAFALFEEKGIFDAATGEAFLTEILEVGGSRPAMVSFEAFRGRKPEVDALLRHSGLAT